VPRPLLRLRSVGLMLVFAAAVALSACSSPTPAGLTNSDMPSDLNILMNASAFNAVAGGAGLDAPLPVGPHEKCPGWYHRAFVPTRRQGEAADGQGVPVTYPEVLVITWRCPSVLDARIGTHLLNGHRKAISGVGDQATVLNRTDDSSDGYPKSRVFIVGWRTGKTVGVLELAGPDSDHRITASLTESLARRAAQSP
jgi:hypothetical protein